MLVVAKQQVILHTFLKYMDHYTSNIMVAVPMQRCKLHVHVHIIYMYSMWYVIMSVFCSILAGVITGLTWNQFTHLEGTGTCVHVHCTCTCIQPSYLIMPTPPSSPSPPPSPCRGGVLCVAMGVNGDVCFSGSTDANIRVWKVPPSDIDPYDNYGEPAPVPH